VRGRMLRMTVHVWDTMGDLRGGDYRLRAVRTPGGWIDSDGRPTDPPDLASCRRLLTDASGRLFPM